MARPGGTLPRFFAPHLDQATVSLDPGEAGHAVRVLRLKVGDAVELFDGSGGLVRAEITEINRKAVICQPDHASLTRTPAHGRSIVIAAPAAKADAAAVMVDMLSQLGAARWIPMICERSVVDPREKKLEKWRRLAIESAKQCGRLHVMAIDEPTGFEQVLQRDADHRRMMLPPGRGEATPGSGLRCQTEPTSRDTSQLLLLIGPEGGFADTEIAAATEAGFLPLTLGDHVLRIETAAVVAATVGPLLHLDATLEP